MRKILFASILLIASMCFGQSSLVCSQSGTGHGTLTTCTLPAIPANGCVRYRFDAAMSGGGFTNTLEVHLNSSTVESLSVYGIVDHEIFQGTICNNGSQSAQWGTYDPISFDAEHYVPSSYMATFAEDFSLTTNTLSFYASVQRGFGVTAHGTVEVLSP